MPIPTAAESKPEPYQSVDDLETPMLLADLDVMEANVEEYISFAERHDVSLRSHVKTHKCPDIARWQHDLTGGGIVCQTLSEVEVMARNGLDDVYLSHTVVDRARLDRLVWLSRKLDSFATTVDGRDNTAPLAAAAERHDATVDVIVEIDVGLGRTGIEPGEPAVDLVRYIDDQPGLNFQGLLAYEAHVKSEAETKAEYERLCYDAMDIAAETVESIEDEGMSVAEVKVGGTATAKYSGSHPVVTEINPGMYPFMDVGELRCRPWEVSVDDCAATVLTTVVSTAVDGRAVVDAGSKSLSLDKPEMPVPKGHDGVEYANASEEHGWLDVTDDDAPEVGDRLEFVTPHVCTTINLHDTIVGVRDGRVEEIWDVAARGKVR